MATNHLQVNTSPIPPNSPGGVQGEDWDRWEKQNSVQFPASSEPNTQDESSTTASTTGKRTLSELLRVHAEHGTDVNFSPEEADRLAEVLGQWINSSSSPYEADDDFFSQPYSHDDSSLPKRSCPSDLSGRPRGRSDSGMRMPA